MRIIESVMIAAACVISLAAFRGSWSLSCLPKPLSSSTPPLPSPPSAASSVADDEKTAAERKKKDAFLLSCLRTVLTEHQLPIGEPHHPRFANVVRAHHYDARRLKLWNADIRFRPLAALEPPPREQYPSSSSSASPQAPVPPPCTVWELGAHTRAVDTAEFLKRYPHCRYHAYEPVQDYAKQLRRWWESEPRVSTHAYGVGVADQAFSLPRSSLRGQSTYLADAGTERGAAANGTGSETPAVVRIVSFQQALHDAGGIHPTVLHMNCEGCEWDFLPQAHAAGFLQRIPVVQVGTHNYGNIGLGPRIWQLCEIRYLLHQTHDLEEGSVAFAWERWVRRRSQR